MSPADEQLRRVAASVARSGLRVPVTLLLDALSPIDVVSSQLARFSMPLVAGTGLAPVAAALADPAAWPELRRLLATPPIQP